MCIRYTHLYIYIHTWLCIYIYYSHSPANVGQWTHRFVVFTHHERQSFSEWKTFDKIVLVWHRSTWFKSPETVCVNVYRQYIIYIYYYIHIFKSKIYIYIYIYIHMYIYIYILDDIWCLHFFVWKFWSVQIIFYMFDRTQNEADLAITWGPRRVDQTSAVSDMVWINSPKLEFRYGGFLSYQGLPWVIPFLNHPCLVGFSMK